jgi:hypothetical protein
MRRAFAGCVLVLATACSGATLDGGSAGDAPVGVDLAAKCAASHGAREVPETAAAFTAALVGRWLVCGRDATSPSLLLAHDGFEFTAAGEWFGLKADTVGGYEHTVNAGTSGTFAILLAGAPVPVSPSDATPTDAITLRLNEPALDVTVAFEVTPPRLHVRAPVDVWLVRLDGGPAEPVPYTSKEGEACDVTTACRGGLACATTAVTDGAAIGVCERAP